LEKAESTIIRKEAIVERPSTGPQPTINEARIREIVREELSARSGSGIPVDVALKRTLGEFNVSVSREVLDVDESSWIGKLLARGVAGFFQEEQGFGTIMSELERVYSTSRTLGDPGRCAEGLGGSLHERNP